MPYFDKSMLPLSGLTDPSVGLSGLLGTAQTMSGQPMAMGAQAATGVTGMPGGPDLNDLLQSINEAPETPGVGMNMPLGGPIWSLAQQQSGMPQTQMVPGMASPVQQSISGGGNVYNDYAGPQELTWWLRSPTYQAMTPDQQTMTRVAISSLDPTGSQQLMSQTRLPGQSAAGDTGGSTADPLALLGKVLGLTPKIYEVGKQYFGQGAESGAGTASPTVASGDWGQGSIPFDVAGGETFGETPFGFGTGQPEPGFQLTQGGQQVDMSGNPITPQSGNFTLGEGGPATLGGISDFGGVGGFGDLALGEWGTISGMDPSTLFNLFNAGDLSSLSGFNPSDLGNIAGDLSGQFGGSVLNPSDFTLGADLGLESGLDAGGNLIGGGLGAIGGAGANLAWGALPIIAKMAGLDANGVQVIQGLMSVIGPGLVAAGILPAGAAGIGGALAGALGASSAATGAVGGALAPFIAWGLDELMDAMQQPMENQMQRVEHVGQTGQMQQSSLNELMGHLASAQTPQQIADAVFSFKAAQQYGGEQGGPAGYWGQDQGLGMLDLPYLPEGGGPTRFGIKFPEYNYNPQMQTLNKMLDLIEQNYGSQLAGYDPRVWRSQDYMPTASFQVQNQIYDPQKLNPFTGEMGYFWQPGETITDFDTAARLGLGDPGTLGMLREQAAGWQPWNEWAGLTQGAPTIWQMLAQTQQGQPQVNALAQPAGVGTLAGDMRNVPVQPSGPAAAIQMAAPGVANVQGLRPGATSVTAPSGMNVNVQGYTPVWDDVTQQWVAAPPGYIQAPPEEL